MTYTAIYTGDVTGLTALTTTEADDASINVGDIGFDFPFGGVNYRTNIFVGSNSYVTFGFGSDLNYNNFTPGKSLVMASADRSWRAIYAGSDSPGSYRIHYEGGAFSNSNPNNSQAKWEVTLFNNGVIMLVTGLLFVGGYSTITDGGANKLDYSISENTSFVFTPSGSTYTVQLGSYTLAGGYSTTNLALNSVLGSINVFTTPRNELNATITDEILQLSGISTRFTGSLAITSSQISVFNPVAKNNSNIGGSSAISYVNSSAISNTANTVSLSQSILTFGSNANSSEFNVLLSQIVDSTINETGLKNRLITYLQPNGTVLNSQFTNVKWLEFVGSVIACASVILKNTYAGIKNSQSGRIDLIAASILSTLSGYVALLGEGNSGNNSFVFWNPNGLDFTKLLLSSANNFAATGYTVSWEIKDLSGLVSNALIVYRDDRNNIGGAKSELARYTTSSTGKLAGTYDSKLDAIGSNVARPTLWVRTKQTRVTGGYVAQSPSILPTAATIGGLFVQAPYAVDLVSSEIEVRSYLHSVNSVLTALSTQIGAINNDSTVNLYKDFVMLIDSGITQPDLAIASAVTGIAHTSNTITISNSRSLAQIYDSRKSYWRDNGGSSNSRIGNTADFGSLNITIAATAAISPSITKFSDGIQTAGTITLTDARAYNGIPFTTAVGGSILTPVGNTDLRTWTLSPNTAINRIGSTGSAIVTLAADQLANAIAGIGVIIQSPQASIRLFGLPNVSNAIISVQDLTSLAITYPAIVAGEVTVNVNTARSYKIRADAPGYLASRFFTIAGTTPEFQFNLADYRSLYLSGVNRASQISFNPTTFVITITDATLALSFADVFRTIEDYLASQQGLAYTAHPFPIILPSKNLLWFPFDTVANAVNPARIKPATTNTSDPELLFETYLEGATDTTYGLFDFTGAGGRIIRIRSEVAIAQVQGDGSFTISDRTKLDGLNATLISSGVFSAPSLANAPGGGGGAADWTTTERGQIRKRLGLDGSTVNPSATPDLALGSALSAIPTNPLLTTDTRLNNLDASVSSRATQSSVDAIPNNSTAIAAIKTQTDKFVFTTIGRVDSTAIGVPTNPLLTTDGRLNFIDASIAANSPANVWSFTTRSLTSAGSTLTAADVWGYTARSLTTPFPTVPSSTDNAIAVRTNLAIELARVDASIASRSSGSAIVAIDSKLDEIKTNTAGGDYVVL